MYFNEVRIRQQAFNGGPKIYQGSFKIFAAEVSQADPDHFGGRALKEQAIEKVRISCEDNQIFGSGNGPEFQIYGRLSKIGGVNAFQRQEGRQSGGKAFIDKQPGHEARRTVLCEALSQRA